MKQSLTIFRALFLLLISSSLFITSCSKDKDKDMAETVPFSGSYTVVEPNETFTLTVVKKSNNNYEIKEFGGFLNAALKAVAEGNILKIPSQTFTNPNGKTITIVGTGSLSTKTTKDDTITFNYTLTGFTNFTGDFTGTRK